MSEFAVQEPRMVKMESPDAELLASNGMPTLTYTPAKSMIGVRRRRTRPSDSSKSIPKPSSAGLSPTGLDAEQQKIEQFQDALLDACEQAPETREMHAHAIDLKEPLHESSLPPINETPEPSSSASMRSKRSPPKLERAPTAGKQNTINLRSWNSTCGSPRPSNPRGAAQKQIQGIQPIQGIQTYKLSHSGHSESPRHQRNTSTNSSHSAISAKHVIQSTGGSGTEEVKHDAIDFIEESHLSIPSRFPTPPRLLQQSSFPSGAAMYSPSSLRGRYDPGDRRLLVGTRLLPSNAVLTPRSQHTATVLYPSESDAGWTARLVVLGGISGVETQHSEYFECDLDDDVLLGNQQLHWNLASLEPLIEPLAAHSSVSLIANDADKFVVFGGSQSASLFSTLYVIDGTSRKSYAALTTGQQPASRSHHSCVISDGVLYVFGGRSDQLTPAPLDNDLVSVSKLDNPALSRIPSTTGRALNQLIRSPKSSANTHHHLLAPCKVFRDLWKLDLRHFQWIRIPLRPDSDPISSRDVELRELKRWPKSEGVGGTAVERVPRGRTSHAACVWGGSQFIYGGFDGETVLDDLWEYNLVTEKWRQLQIKGRGGGRCAAACCLVGDRWLMHGGLSDIATLQNDFYVLDLATLSGTRVRVDVNWDPPKLLPSLAYHAAVPVLLPGSKQSDTKAVILLGGYGKHGQQCNAVYIVAFRSDLMDITSELPPSKHSFFQHFLPASTLAAVGGGGTDRRSGTPHKIKDAVSKRLPPRERILPSEKVYDELPPPRHEPVHPPNSSTPPTTEPPTETTESEQEPVVVSRGAGDADRNSVDRGTADRENVEDRVAYLANRLHEQKFENLQLRTLTRETATLRQRLAEIETELEQYNNVRRHPLLGPVMKSCLDVLGGKGKIETSKLKGRKSRCVRCLMVMDVPTPAEPCGHTRLCKSCISPGTYCPECNVPLVTVSL